MMSPLLALALCSPAVAWPDDAAWQPALRGGSPVQDAPGDATGPGADLTGDPAEGAVSWFADDHDLAVRLRLDGDPSAGPDLVPGAWVVGLDRDGDHALDALLAVEGPDGALTAWPLDGAPGLPPAAASFGAARRLGDLASAAVRVAPRPAGGAWLDLRVDRAVLAGLGLTDQDPVRLAVATGATLDPWTDLAGCAGACADDADAFTDAAPIDPDLDGRGTPLELADGTDPADADSDDDGVLDGAEPVGDTDGDGAVDGRDCDADADAVLDGTEAGLFLAALGPDTDLGAGCWRADADTTNPPTDPARADTDDGGRADGLEDLDQDGALDPWETDPTDPADDADTDGDGLPDAVEALGADGAVDDADSDGDGLDDALEWLWDGDGDGLPAFLDPDSDGDGLPDAAEGGTDTDGDGAIDAFDGDADGDGLSDAFEGDGDTDGDTIPDHLDPDADGDAIPDAFEGAGDYDLDGIPDFRDLDADGDGIPDAVEGTGDTDQGGSPDFRDGDSDNDGIGDAIEGTDDVDGDGLPNYRDPNSDGAGWWDVDEGTGDPDCDGLPAFVDPDEEDGFCDEPQDPPGVVDGDAPPAGRTPDPPGGVSYGGGACDQAGGGPSAAWLLLALLARRGRVARLAWLGWLPTAAAAQGVDAQRFAPVVDGGPFAKVVDGDVGPARSGTFGAWLSQADDPLVQRAPGGRERPLLGVLSTTSLVASGSTGDVRLGVELPVHTMAIGAELAAPAHVGDVRITGELAALRADEVRLGLWGDATLPTGRPEVWLGAGVARATGGAAVSARTGALAFAGNFGYRSGTPSRLGGLVVGPALVGAAGAAWDAADDVSLSLEVDREDWLGNSGEPGATPMEWLAGVHALTDRATLTLGVGGGLSRGVGAPDLRLVAGLRVGVGRVLGPIAHEETE